MSGVKIGVDADALLDFSKRAAQAAKLTTPTLIVGLNEVGDGLVSTLARTLSRDTGVTLAQVRALMKVERATRNRPAYEVSISRGLFDEDTSQIEGGRGSSNFGTRRPGALVLVISQKDELVCMDCTAMEAMGPVTIEFANEHVPVHPNCRCVIVPYVQPRRRLPVTFTTVTGTSSRRRAGTKPIDQDRTIRQLAQDILDRSATTIKVQLT